MIRFQIHIPAPMGGTERGKTVANLLHDCAHIGLNRHPGRCSPFHVKRCNCAIRAGGRSTGAARTLPTMTHLVSPAPDSDKRIRIPTGRVGAGQFLECPTRTRRRPARGMRPPFHVKHYRPMPPRRSDAGSNIRGRAPPRPRVNRTTEELGFRAVATVATPAFNRRSFIRLEPRIRPGTSTRAGRPARKAVTNSHGEQNPLSLTIIRDGRSSVEGKVQRSLARSACAYGPCDSAGASLENLS